jgi:hypothetical protein
LDCDKISATGTQNDFHDGIFGIMVASEIDDASSITGLIVPSGIVVLYGIYVYKNP